jgi:hypothetical protein
VRCRMRPQSQNQDVRRFVHCALKNVVFSVLVLQHTLSARYESWTITLVLLHLLIQNGIFHPSLPYSLSYSILLHSSSFKFLLHPNNQRVGHTFIPTPPPPLPLPLILSPALLRVNAGRSRVPGRPCPAPAAPPAPAPATSATPSSPAPATPPTLASRAAPPLSRPTREAEAPPSSPVPGGARLQLAATEQDTTAEQWPDDSLLPSLPFSSEAPHRRPQV